MFTSREKYWNCLVHFYKSFFILLFFLANNQLGYGQIVGDSPIFPTDVELEISAPNVTIGQWKKLPVTVTIRNIGDVAAENVVVRIGTCAGSPESVTFDTRSGGIVYTSKPYTFTSGVFRKYGSSWLIPRVEGNTFESITIEYFTLTDGPIKLFAFVEKMDSEDVDSFPQPNVFGLSCEVTEDDEALLILNPDITPFACEGDVVLTTQQEVDDFGNTCFDVPVGRSYNGSIKIDGSDITNLDALADLRVIDGDLLIFNTSIESLGQVLQIGATLTGKFIAIGNKNLKEINLGSAIGFSGDDIEILNNASLEEIKLPFGVANIRRLYVQSNPSLQEIDLNGLTTIRESLSIFMNPELDDLNSFTSLTAVGKLLVIESNGSLTSLQGLENLEYDNALSTVDGISLGVLIKKNGNLSQCCEVLNQITEAVAVNDEYRVEIFNNDSGCTSFEEITTDCNINTTCDLLSIIDIDFCSDPSIDLVATYLYQGRLYLGTSDSGLDAFTEIVDCETGELLCLYDPLSITLETACPDFFQESEQIEVISRKSECPGCGCGEIDPYTGIPYEEVCGSDGKTYASECAAECAEVSWTYGPCDDGEGITCGEITITPGESYLTIKGATGKDYYFKVYRTSPKWEYVFECTRKCGSEVLVENLSIGTYFVDVYNSSWKLICDDIEVIVSEEENCICTQEVFPVCGTDGRNYGNPCLAACAGVEVAYDGPCDIDPPVECAAIDFESLDPCDPFLKELALYEYRGEIYSVFVPEFNLDFQDLETTATNCSTGELKCVEALLLGVNPEVIPCFEFFEEATKLEVLVSKEDCEDCNCPIPGPLEVFNGVCGSDGKTYTTPCDAECAGVAWTDGPCDEGGITCGEITVTPGIDQLTIRGTAGKNYFFKVHRTSPTWEYVLQCNADCGSEITLDNLPSGRYFVDVYNSSWKLICDDIEVDLIAIGGIQDTHSASRNKNSVLNSTNAMPSNPIMVYPNPAQNTVYVQMDIKEYTTAHIYISNHLGQIVKRLPFTQFEQNTISLESFSNGVYQINVIVDGELVANEKLVVMK